MLESYLTEELIRIDNGGSNSPFGIFFVVCVVAVLAITAIHSESPIVPRILATDPPQPPKGSLSNFVEYIKTHEHRQPEVC